MTEPDLVIRGGDVVDGTGAPARPADVAIAGDTIVAVGDVGPSGGATEHRRHGPDGHAGLRRHPRPLRRSGHVVEPTHAVVLARRHDAGRRQLRRRVRSGAPRRPRPAHRAHGRRRGHPRRRPPRRAQLGVAELPRVPRRARRPPVRRRPRRPRPARRAAAARHGRPGCRPRSRPPRRTSPPWPRSPPRRSRPAPSASRRRAPSTTAPAGASRSRRSPPRPTSWSASPRRSAPPARASSRWCRTSATWRASSPCAAR